MQTQTVIFMGPQGSGKGTQVENFISYLRENDPAHKVVDLQTGRGFRALKDSDTYTAERITEIIESGHLVPDFLTQAVVIDDLKERLTVDAHLTLDGFPRNIEQAEFFDKILSFYNRPSLAVVYLDTPEDVVRERMMGRGRSDDSEEGINLRLKLYKEETEPIVDFYKNRPDTNFIQIDGSLPIVEVFNKITEGLSI